MSPNTNYQTGRREEYACMKRWREKGYIVARSAGSHGMWDVCAVRQNVPVELIQCKVIGTERAALTMLQNFRNDPPIIASPHFHQVLEVRVKNSKRVLTATV